MRILFVAMAGSIHTARWINQIADQGWDIHLFPSDRASIHPELGNITIHDRLIRSGNVGKNVKQDKSLPWPFPVSSDLPNRVLSRLRDVELARWTTAQSQRLERLIAKIKPDIVHSLEMQLAGYLTLSAREQFGVSFPAWIMSIWGSDIYHFGRMPEHISKIEAVLSVCDYFACECKRDVALASSFGFKGEVLPVLPASSGFNIEQMQHYRQPGPISTRKLIMLKGYHGWAGRALVGLRAIEMSAAVLKGYHIAIYVANEEVRIAANQVSNATGIPIEIVPNSSHEDILRLHGRARVSIGLSISDGASTSMLEAMAMGSFPIQSCTACADEWIEDGISGLIVPPEDSERIAEAIRRAVTDDHLVDSAACLNQVTVGKRLNYKDIQKQVKALYEDIERKS